MPDGEPPFPSAPSGHVPQWDESTRTYKLCECGERVRCRMVDDDPADVHPANKVPLYYCPVGFAAQQALLGGVERADEAPTKDTEKLPPVTPDGQPSEGMTDNDWTAVQDLIAGLKDEVMSEVTVLRGDIERLEARIEDLEREIP